MRRKEVTTHSYYIKYFICWVTMPTDKIHTHTHTYRLNFNVCTRFLWSTKMWKNHSRGLLKLWCGKVLVFVWFHSVMMAFRWWHLGKYWTSGSRDPANLFPDTSSAIWPWKAICHWMDSVAPCASRAHAGSNLFSRSLRTMNKSHSCYIISKEEACTLFITLCFRLLEEVKSSFQEGNS